MESYPWRIHRRPEFSGQTPKRIIDEVGDSFRNIRVITSAALIVERMHPAAVIEHHPKGVLFQLGEVRHDRDKYGLDAFFVKREGKMVMINDIMALLRSENYRNHMLAKEFGALGVAFLAPALSFRLYLPHADRDLCRTKVRDWDRIEKRLTYVGHRYLLMFLRNFRQFQSHQQLQKASEAPLAHPQQTEITYYVTRMRFNQRQNGRVRLKDFHACRKSSAA
jgi:hypothetical protein